MLLPPPSLAACFFAVAELTAALATFASAKKQQQSSTPFTISAPSAPLAASGRPRWPQRRRSSWLRLARRRGGLGSHPPPQPAHCFFACGRGAIGHAGRPCPWRRRPRSRPTSSPRPATWPTVDGLSCIDLPRCPRPRRRSP